ncbi:hypothetical protein M5225_001647 [Vibrio vulnificus]|uniref:hypothetical protein n=1 Tax=Vibrio vulnificus TaxID=672 RepID=UPI000C9E2653|nr:hypothetical protein [Vibrio vulnificus]EHZ2901699.1 hypothetical protein [Vibrio vulnificus]EIA1336683.1 hypothetical protein [Vibrio vulnificus]EIU7594671.1 hypothetical protein [Vibrio vulnificus]EIX4869577.1 hypothetical protein [Vibrio vulnificus]EJE8687511.1 hypothetical protein [Vibrio vulnificus]
MSKLTLAMAALEYINRQRNKQSPKGEWVCHTYFIADKHKEREQCCAKYENDLPHAPRIIWDHCKSIEHIAQRYQVNSADLELEISSIYKKAKRKKRK